MPSADRYWRVYLGFGIVMIVIGVASSIALFVDMPPSGESWISVLAHMDWMTLAPVAFCGLWGVNAISMANKCRKRQRLRARAHAGDEAAMPLAGVKPQGVKPAALEREPIELLRLPFRASWFVVGLLLFLAPIITAAITVVMIDVFLSSTWKVVACGEGVAALEVGLGVWLLRARRRTKPTGVVATDAGLRWVRGGKEWVFIPWDEARLLEFWRSDPPNWGRGFALSSDHAMVEWRDYPPGEGPAAADGSSSDVLYLRGQALLQTIIARTGLEPRGCGPLPSLEGRAELVARTSERSWRNTLLGSTVWLVIVAIPLAAAAGALLAPLTDSLVVNLYVAVTMGALGLWLLGWFWRWLVQFTVGLVQFNQRVVTQPVPRPAIRLKVRRANAILVGVLLLVAGEFYALGRGLMFMYSVTTLSESLPWWDLRFLTITTLGFISFIIGLIAFAALLYKTPRGFVDE